MLVPVVYFICQPQPFFAPIQNTEETRNEGFASRQCLERDIEISLIMDGNEGTWKEGPLISFT